MHRDIIDLRGKTEMEGYVEPAHPLPKPKIDDDVGFHACTGGEIEYDRKFLVAHTVMLFHVNDFGFRYAIVVADGEIKASQLSVRDGYARADILGRSSPGQYESSEHHEWGNEFFIKPSKMWGMFSNYSETVWKL